MYRPFSYFLSAALAVCLAVGVLRATAATRPAVSETQAVVQSQGGSEGAPAARSLPLVFELNNGQAPSGVAFIARTGGYTLFLSQDEAVWRLEGSAGDTEYATDRRYLPSSSLRMRIPSLQPGQLHGEEPLAGQANYFTGNDPTAWRTALPLFRRVVQSQVQPGIDIAYYQNDGGELEFDFIVAPGADVSRLALEFSGATRAAISAGGDLQLDTAAGALTFRAPSAYQPAGGGRRAVGVSHRLVSSAVPPDGGTIRVQFALSAFDKRLPLVIDPAVTYQTYPGNGFGYESAVDGSGNAYVTGFVSSLNPPANGSLGGTRDAFITKLNSNGGIVYSTYIGGSSQDEGRGIFVDGAGAAFITGFTMSSDYPTHAALQPSFGGGSHDAFVTALSPSGSALQFSTYIGGNAPDFGGGIARAPGGDILAVGITNSTDFPTAVPVQATMRGPRDAYVLRLRDDGAQLEYSTFFGGDDCDNATGVAADSAGNAYVVGQTYSWNFPTRNAAQSGFGGNGSGNCSNTVYGGDGIIFKLDSGGALIYSTFLGGSQGEMVNDVAVDASGAAYVVGRTDSANFPAVNARQSSYGGGPGGALSGGDAFVAKLNPAGTQFDFATFLGGSGGDSGLDIALDGGSNAYVTGFTMSDDFPLASPFQAAHGGDKDVFVTKVAANGSRWLYSSYLGNSSTDGGFGIAVDAARNAYVTGYIGGSIVVARVALRSLTVSRAGTGTGMVQSAPAGINCGTTCAASFNVGTAVTLTPTAAAGSQFVSWNAACPNGAITLNQDTSCIATFSKTTTGNTAPTISNVSDQTTTPGAAVGPLAFTVGDAETAAGSLTVTATSSNTTLVPQANIAVGGSGANRTVTVSPAPNQVGQTTVTLTVSDGSLTSNDTFTVTVQMGLSGPAPTISSVAPNSGPTSGGTAVTLNGTNFIEGATALMWDIPLTNVQVVNATTLTGVTGPRRVAGGVTVIVRNPDGQSGQLPGGFKYVLGSSSLGVTSINPASGPTAGGTAVTIAGTGFATGAAVTIGGVAATNVQVVSATTISAVTGPRAAGTVKVVVTSGGQTATLTNGYTYSSGTAPTVTQITPNNGATAGGTSVTVAGTNFASGLSLALGGVAATSVVVVNATTITAVTGPRAAGTVNVVVTNPDNSSGTLPNAFTYNAPAAGNAPTVATISPPSGSTTGGTPVTVTGTNFAPGAAVKFWDVALRDVVVVDSTTITGLTGPRLAAGGVTVMVQNTDGQTGSKAGAFTYTVPGAGPTPAVAQVSPASGSTAGGTSITITGTNFVSGATVSVGGIPATDVLVVDSTTITAVTAARPAGVVSVAVVNPSGRSAIKAGAYTYVAAP